MTLKTGELLEHRIDGLEHSGFGQTYSEENYPPVSDQERRCAQDLIAIISRMKRVIAHDREGSGFPITLQQYHVLKRLKEQELLISELADMFEVSRPTMSRIIDGLEGRRRNNHDDATEHKERRGKLVERVDSTDDRRLVYARITPEGLQMLDYYCAKSEESVAAVLRRIEPSEMADLEQALNVLRCALESGS